MTARAKKPKTGAQRDQAERDRWAAKLCPTCLIYDKVEFVTCECDFDQSISKMKRYYEANKHGDVTELMEALYHIAIKYKHDTNPKPIPQINAPPAPPVPGYKRLLAIWSGRAP